MERLAQTVTGRSLDVMIAVREDVIHTGVKMKRVKPISSGRDLSSRVALLLSRKSEEIYLYYLGFMIIMRAVFSWIKADLVISLTTLLRRLSALKGQEWA